jgi:hypothetical protein
MIYKSATCKKGDAGPLNCENNVMVACEKKGMGILLVEKAIMQALRNSKLFLQHLPDTGLTFLFVLYADNCSLISI